MSHRFIPNTRDIRAEMLEEIGLSDIKDLFVDIPEEIRLKRELNLPAQMPELDVGRHIVEISSKNKNFNQAPVFLGGGVWPHHIPAHVRSIVQRAEFLTAYTPYQPEVSQGMLQAQFEYQSLITELVGLEVANSSMYDWGSAAGEAALMSARLTGRKKFLVPDLISPERLSVIENYAVGPGLRIEKVSHDRKSGLIDLDELKKKLDRETAGVYVENPSYLGFLETQADEISEMAHSGGAVFVVGVNPISLGIIKPPGEYGADIVVGEGQPLGNPVSFGGPTLGIFACRGEQRFIRQMPGRIIGMTLAADGKTRGYTMVLQTREQHIRREKATSNICSNQALCAVAAAAYLATLGSEGLREVASICASNARYVMKRLSEIDGIQAPVFDSSHFNEFTLKCNKKGATIEKINSELLKRGVHGGKSIRGEFPELGETALLCTTELHSKRDIDKLVEATAEAVEVGK